MNEIDPIIGRTLPRLLREALADPDTLVVSHLWIFSRGDVIQLRTLGSATTRLSELGASRFQLDSLPGVTLDRAD